MKTEKGRGTHNAQKSNTQRLLQHVSVCLCNRQICSFSLSLLLRSDAAAVCVCMRLGLESVRRLQYSVFTSCPPYIRSFLQFFLPPPHHLPQYFSPPKLRLDDGR